jgi:hypothetical protein
MPHELVHIVVLVVLLALAAGFFLGAVKAFKYAHVIMDTPASKIRSAAQGYVELQGIIKPLTQPLIAPLTNSPCCWYEYLIEEEYTTVNSKGETVTDWRTVDSHASSHLFYIEDDTGRVVVYPLSAEVTAKSHDVWYGSSLQQYAGASGVSSIFSQLVGSLTGTNYRFTEWRLDADQQLVALGFFHTCRKGETPFALDHVQANRQQLLQKKRAVLSRHKVLRGLADALVSGGSQQLANVEQEWGTVLQQQDAKVCHVLHKKERPFILSSYSEKKLVRKYYWRTAGCTIGFVFFVVMFLLMLGR